jgi:hypothetical protein
MTEASVKHLDRAGWRALAGACPAYDYRQVWEYATLLAQRRGARAEFVAIESGGSTVGAAQVRIKRVPVLGAGVAYVSGGVLVVGCNGDREARLRTALEGLIAEYVRRRGLALRVVPTALSPDEMAQDDAVYRGLGFVVPEDARKHRTILVDLRKPVEGLRSSLVARWRTSLNQAQRAETALEVTDEPDSIDAFIPMFDAMHERIGFELGLHPEFYSKVQRASERSERLCMLYAKHNGEKVGAVGLSLHGRVGAYVLGATTMAGREVNAAYRLQWEAMLLAKQRGCEWYDLGGIDPDGNPGVHRFKKGTGGLDVTAPGPFDFAPGGLRGAAFRAVKSLRRWRRARALKSQAAAENAQNASGQDS